MADTQVRSHIGVGPGSGEWWRGPGNTSATPQSVLADNLPGVKWSLHPQACLPSTGQIFAVTTQRNKVIWESKDSPVRLDSEIISKSQQPFPFILLF